MKRRITVRLNAENPKASEVLNGISGISDVKQTALLTSLKATITGESNEALDAIEAKIKAELNVEEIVLTIF